ncbi:hypothetical protein A4X09_0g139 [Tilletia walkeri]|uniref:GPI anchored protein n=1 Tax=Tilletia walkeri TaxID=117179 RepID=A0A8X7T7U4_9BASI|nr:hypothetical protein A4X09_0g139 [Tilletia walkeri]
MFGSLRINSIFLLTLGTALAVVRAESDPTLPERVQFGQGEAKLDLYRRADPLNLFGLLGPRNDLGGDAIGQVIDGAVGLARGLNMEERQRVCTNAGYGLCPDGSGCCPAGGQCCPGNVYNRYECCPAGTVCNGIDGCRVGRRACPKDAEACCPIGSSCLYGSGGNATQCSSFGFGGDTASDTLTFSTVSSSSTAIFGGLPFTYTSTQFPPPTATLPTPNISTTTPTSSSTSTTASTSGFVFPFAGVTGAATPRFGDGASMSIVVVAIAFVAGTIAL